MPLEKNHPAILRVAFCIKPASYPRHSVIKRPYHDPRNASLGTPNAPLGDPLRDPRRDPHEDPSSKVRWTRNGSGKCTNGGMT